MPNNTKTAPSKVRRIVGITILVALVLTFLLMFRKPAPVASPMKPAEVAANAESFQQKLTSLSTPAVSDVDSATAHAVVDEVRFTADEVQAALVQANSPVASGQTGSTAIPSAPGPQSQADQYTLESTAPLVTFENDVVKGQFRTELAGQAVIVTVAGHLGSKDGYATFDPTEFKIGDVIVPVSMVNGSLQKKLDEQREKLKLPDFVSDIEVKDGHLVIKRK